MELSGSGHSENGSERSECDCAGRKRVGNQGILAPSKCVEVLGDRRHGDVVGVSLYRGADEAGTLARMKRE